MRPDGPLLQRVDLHRDRVLEPADVGGEGVLQRAKKPFTGSPEEGDEIGQRDVGGRVGQRQHAADERAVLAPPAGRRLCRIEHRRVEAERLTWISSPGVTLRASKGCNGMPDHDPASHRRRGGGVQSVEELGQRHRGRPPWPVYLLAPV